MYDKKRGLRRLIMNGNKENTKRQRNQMNYIKIKQSNKTYPYYIYLTFSVWKFTFICKNVTYNHVWYFD